MKQNLQTPATPLEMLSLFLPAGLLDYFFNDTATTEIYTLSLHDALPIFALNDSAIAFEERWL